METEELVSFIKAKKKGIYPVLVHHFSSHILGVSVSIAKEIIEKELAKQGHEVVINYFNLRKAIKKARHHVATKKSVVSSISLPKVSKTTTPFKDDYETDSSKEPGKF